MKQSAVNLNEHYDVGPPAETCTASARTDKGPVPANGSAAREGVHFTDLTHRLYLTDTRFCRSS